MDPRTCGCIALLLGRKPQGAVRREQGEGWPGFAGLHPFGPWPVWVWLLGFVMGFLQPDWLLERRIARRRKAILVELPTVLDLLAMAASAGLSRLACRRKFEPDR